jgi:putative membrane protein
MKKTALSLALLLVVTACAKDQKEASNAAMDTTNAAASAATTPVPADSTAAPAGALTDPQIAAIVIAADDVDIQGGQQALTKATNQKVKDFAQRMVTDHTAVNKQVHDLLTKLNATPASNPTRESMTQQGQEASTRLGALSGAAYDKAYIDNEVTFHQQVINAAQTQLAPAAQNAELKDLLQKTMPVLQSHLDMAKQIQSSLPAS